MSILIKFGPGNQTTREVADYPTVDSILSSETLRLGLGFGANVEARVNDVAGVTALQDGDVVNIVSRSSTKG